MAIYSILKLTNDGKSVRLLTIEPSTHHRSVVCCHLRVVEIQPGVQYEALSYCWGDPSSRDIISVNGAEISVTKSLASALHALRDLTHPRTLWVDAICIDQNNLAEKAFQVPLMSLIYGRCSRTIIWLGECDKDSRKAFELVRKGIKEYPRILSSVLRRPWFRRIWIVQELALSPTALVQCGNDIIDWDQLAAVVALIPAMGSTVNPRSDGEYKHLHPAFYPRILDSARKRVKDGELFDLHEALRSFQPFEATLPVDKVFGIISLLKEPDMIEVDYTLSPWDVYQKVALDLLQSSRNLDLFLDCLQSVKGPQIAGLPSWVPDWSAIDQPLDNPILTVTAKEIFQASSGTQLPIPIQHNKDTIILQAHFIGQVSDLGDPIPSVAQLREQYWPKGHWVPHRRAFEFVTMPTTVLDSWKAVICRRKEGTTIPLTDMYPTGETLLEVMYHTLNFNGGPFPDIESSIEFIKWMQSIELTMRIIKVYGRMVAWLPWFIVWLISGPYFVSWSFVLGIEIFRHNLVFDAPMTHSDPSRQAWVFGRTDRDLVGLFPAPNLSSSDTIPSVVGDSLVIFKGGARPYVIRKVQKGWKIIGSTYIHGIMYGAAFDESQCQDINLV